MSTRRKIVASEGLVLLALVILAPVQAAACCQEESCGMEACPTAAAAAAERPACHETPQTQTPQTQIPQSQAPQSQAPQSPQAPQSQAPQSQAPQSVAPICCGIDEQPAMPAEAPASAHTAPLQPMTEAAFSPLPAAAPSVGVRPRTAPSAAARAAPDLCTLHATFLI